jgi:hypothetical protein
MPGTIGLPRPFAPRPDRPDPANSPADNKPWRRSTVLYSILYLRYGDNQ